jgi:hypothetical protein
VEEVEEITGPNDSTAIAEEIIGRVNFSAQASNWNSPAAGLVILRFSNEGITLDPKSGVFAAENLTIWAVVFPFSRVFLKLGPGPRGGDRVFRGVFVYPLLTGDLPWYALLSTRAEFLAHVRQSERAANPFSFPLRAQLRAREIT